MIVDITGGGTVFPFELVTVSFNFTGKSYRKKAEN